MIYKCSISGCSLILFGGWQMVYSIAGNGQQYVTNVDIFLVLFYVWCQYWWISGRWVIGEAGKRRQIARHWFLWLPKFHNCAPRAIPCNIEFHDFTLLLHRCAIPRNFKFWCSAKFPNCTPITASCATLLCSTNQQLGAGTCETSRKTWIPRAPTKT